MKVIISFTAAFIAFVNGKLSRQDLRKSVLCFGCDRAHLFRKRGEYPMEITWVSDSLHHYDSRVPVKRSQVSNKTYRKWLQFRKEVLRAEEKGRIAYRIGNYPQLETFLLLSVPDIKVWNNHRWAELKDVSTFQAEYHRLDRESYEAYELVTGRRPPEFFPEESLPLFEQGKKFYEKRMEEFTRSTKKPFEMTTELITPERARAYLKASR